MSIPPAYDWPARLTPKQFLLAETLRKAGRQMSWDEVITELYGPKGASRSTLKVLLHRLREKLPEGVSIRTSYGEGIEMVADDGTEH